MYDYPYCNKTFLGLPPMIRSRAPHSFRSFISTVSHNHDADWNSISRRHWHTVLDSKNIVIRVLWFITD
jgi:hypothetical protein